jgi:hypothetical protein
MVISSATNASSPENTIFELNPAAILVAIPISA